MTYVRRRWGPSGLVWGAGRRKERTVRTVGLLCCAGSRRTRLRSCSRSSCTWPGRSDTRWSAGYTRTLRKKGTKIHKLHTYICVTLVNYVS